MAFMKTTKKWNVYLSFGDMLQEIIDRCLLAVPAGECKVDKFVTELYTTDGVFFDSIQ